MRNILEEFALGNLPLEDMTYSRDSRYKQALRDICDSEAKLSSKL